LSVFDGEIAMAKKASGKSTKVVGAVPAKRVVASSDPKPLAGPIAGASDWREERLAEIRRLLFEAVPDAVEEVKWRKPSNGMRGVPTWSRDGLICTGETYKNYVKITFARGAALADPSGLFNSSLDGGTRRAIDFHEGDKIDEKALKALVLAAAAQNGLK
jgi:hypothetical protein